jgi:uncharacterized membrane protein
MKLKTLETYFFTGFIILLPLIITYEVVGFILHFFTPPFEWLVKKVFQTQELPSFVLSIVALLCLFLLALFVGMIGRWVVGRWLLHVADSIIDKIPVVNSVYSSFKRLIDTAIAPKSDAGFRQVALVPFPNLEQKSIGFVTRQFTNEQYTHLPKEFVLVLIPASPNPITGILAAFPKEQVTLIDSRPDEALKVILSCGSLKFH